MGNQSVNVPVKLPSGQLLGFFDGEYVTSNAGIVLYRVDGDEIYTYGTNAKLLGCLVENVANSIAGEMLFTIA